MYEHANRKRLKYTYFPHPPEYKIAYYTMYPEKCDGPCNFTNEVMKNLNEFGSDRGDMYMRYHNYMSIVESVESVAKELMSQKNKQKWLTKYANRMDVYSFGMCIVDMMKHLAINRLTVSEQHEWVKWIVYITHPDVRKRYTPLQALEAMKKLQKKLCGKNKECNGLKKKKII
jgi:hypothetical protein